MCFEKVNGTQWAEQMTAKEDIYVAKRSKRLQMDTEIFTSEHTGFVYQKNKVYRKSWLKRWRAKDKTEINGEAFHSWNLDYFKQFIYWSAGWNDGLHKLGIFRIPKGTKYYADDVYVASFAIEFVEVITNANIKKWIPDIDMGRTYRNSKFPIHTLMAPDQCFLNFAVMGTDLYMGITEPDPVVAQPKPVKEILCNVEVEKELKEEIEKLELVEEEIG